MDDLISRQSVLKAIDEYDRLSAVSQTVRNATSLREVIKWLPSAQPEIKPIDYRDCADAMLKMWMDNVVTDGEYNRIMDKLNAHYGYTRHGGQR